MGCAQLNQLYVDYVDPILTAAGSIQDCVKEFAIDNTLWPWLGRKVKVIILDKLPENFVRKCQEGLTLAYATVAPVIQKVVAMVWDAIPIIVGNYYLPKPLVVLPIITLPLYDSIFRKERKVNVWSGIALASAYEAYHALRTCIFQRDPVELIATIVLAVFSCGSFYKSKRYASLENNPPSP